MEYWEVINKKLELKELGQKVSMRRLNDARGALKHQGTLLSDLDIESFRATTVNFFQDNTQIVFGIDLNDISLIEFVNPEEPRNRLKKAQVQIDNGEVVEALVNIGTAFKQMIADYEDRKQTRRYGSPFLFGRSMTIKKISNMGFDINNQASSRELKKFMDSVAESIEAMQDAIKILALGIDYRKYTKFEMLTPITKRLASGKWVTEIAFKSDNTPTAEDARFCLDFVIEVSLALSEFDYSIDQG